MVAVQPPLLVDEREALDAGSSLHELDRIGLALGPGGGRPAGVRRRRSASKPSATVVAARAARSSRVPPVEDEHVSVGVVEERHVADAGVDRLAVEPDTGLLEPLA